MTDSLRDRQKQVARETILRAAADLIVESGLESLSLADVAHRAGVAKRTLYNYFDSRETLLSELGRWSDDLTLEQGGYLVPEGLDRLPQMIPAVWRTWAAQGTIHQAVLKVAAASSPSGVSADRRRRQAAIADAITEIRPDLGSARANELAAVFHAIASAPVYERLTTQDGLDVDRAGALIGWVIGVVRDALENGADPFETNDASNDSSERDPR